MEPLIHIGYHKAGSTWLQKNLFSQAERGFLPLCPPDCGWSKARRPKYLARHFVYSEDGYLLSPFTERTAEAVEEARAIFARGGGGVPVISSERLSGNPHASGFDAAAICDRLHAAFPDARILIVIREQISAIVSTYFQYLRNGGHRSITHYLTTRYDGRRPGFSFAHFEYDRAAEYYRQRFRPERVLVLPFEMLASEPERFVASIGALVGVEIGTDLPFGTQENRGFPRRVEVMTRYLNLLRRADSVNGYALAPWRPAGRMITAARRGLAPWVGERRERRCIEESSALCRDLCGDRFAGSNERTSRLVGRDLRSDFGYM